ncbi:MAG: hypothetical protein C5B49_02195 [Bdellovibrio sp.]|nr:MAG: hypothetical protein C5B49_02195 [Bdellovibrio sp.]
MVSRSVAAAWGRSRCRDCLARECKFIHCGCAVKNASLRTHLFYSLGLALVLRLFCGFFVWGPQGLDDYLDNLIPAWRWTQGLDPGLQDYRSPFYVYILRVWLGLGEFFGIKFALWQIRWVYFFQGLCSLLAIAGVYLLVRRHPDKRAARISLYLCAAHAVMPFASTRSFMESFAIGFTTLGVAFLVEDERRLNPGWRSFWGWALVGFSTLARFQIGIIYLAWGLVLIFRRRAKALLYGLVCGCALLVAEGLIDWGYGRYPFQTLHDYFVFNQDQSKSGVMPWYNTWLTWLGALFFPVSLVFARKWLQAFREYGLLLVPVLSYVVTHSIYPHKEERYLYPILALSLVFMARACSLAADSPGFRWIFRPFFWFLNTLALVVFCFVNTQESLVGPYAKTQLLSSRVLYFDFDHLDARDWMSEFFTRGTSVVLHPSRELQVGAYATSGFTSSAARGGSVGTSAFAATWIEQESAKYPQLDRFALISSSPEAETAFRKSYQDLSVRHECTELFEASSLTDRILYRVNPKGNPRRRGSLFFSCRSSDIRPNLFQNKRPEFSHGDGL